MSPNPLPTGSRPGLLIVDDDPLIVDTLGYVLGADFSVTTAVTRADGIEKLRGLAVTPPLALVDLGLPPCPHRPDEGFALIGELLAHSPDMKIIVLSGQNEEANARHARTLGAIDFVAKPADPAHLRQLLRNTLSFTCAEVVETASDECLVGESPAICKLRIQIRQYADSPFPVLIEGESGSGKEIVASHCLHQMTSRWDKPFFALNCAAISPALVEPTLFGYAKGAFTGAVTQKSGYFEDASDGTLFLDEIGELPLELQSKLLRVLENGEYQRVGETQTHTSRARVIAATNRDLRREVREGRFRADLYHRLSVFTVSMPPLREMEEDRLLLLEHFTAMYAAQLEAVPFRLSAEARQCWLAYTFPGNVRELRNIVIRLTARHPGETVDAATLEDEFDAYDLGTVEDSGATADFSAIALRELQRGQAFNLDELLHNWERAYIEAAQRLANGNISQAAKLLGVNRTTLYNRMDSLSRVNTSD